MSTQEKEELRTYKDAVWAFILEHCDLTDSGALFVKFHTDGRADLEKRIRARWKYDYHRMDTRTGEDIVAKEARHIAQREAFVSDRKGKRDRYHARKRRRAFWGRIGHIIRRLTLRK